MRFGNDNEGTELFPSEIAHAVTEYVDKVTTYYESLSPADRNSASDQMYSVMQKVLPDASWQKIGPKELRVQGIPSPSNLASMMYQAGTCKMRLVFYIYGGSTQMKGGKIIRSATINWTNEEPEGELSRTDKSSIEADGTTASITGLFAMMQSHLTATANEAMNAKKREDERIERMLSRHEHLTNKVIEVAKDYAEDARATLAAARGDMNQAHDMRLRAMRTETDAHQAERRAILKLEEAESMLENAEEALERGETEGWQRLIRTIIESPAGQQLMGPMIGRIFDVIDSKFFGNGATKEMNKLGMADLATIMTEMNLTPEQAQKAQEIFVRFTNKEKKS